MEYTRNELKLDNSYIINVTNVEMLPYTHRSSPPDKPTIVGLDKGEISFDVRTSFNILKTLELRYDEMVTQNNGLKEYEKELAKINQNIILIMRSSFLIQNMELLSEFSDINFPYNFFFPVYIQDRWIIFRDLHTSTSGLISFTYDPANMIIENIHSDFYRNYGGFSLSIDCNYPEAYMNASIYSDNTTFYYSQERMVFPAPESTLRSEMPGEFIVSNYIGEVYNVDVDGTGTFALFPKSTCIPDLDNIRYFKATNITMPMRKYELDAYNMLFLQLQSDIYRETQATLNNVSCSDSQNTIFPCLGFFGNTQTEVHLENSY